ncbi:MAG: hypothetical protein ACE5KU_01385 [Nitrososphaerales archaeon]
MKNAATMPKTPLDRDTRMKAVHAQSPESRARPEPAYPTPLALFLDNLDTFSEIVTPDSTETIRI